MSPAVKTSFAAGALGTPLFTAIVGDPFVGAALGVLLVIITAAVLTAIEARHTTEDTC